MIARHLSPNVLWTFAGILALLVTASVLVAVLSLRGGTPAVTELRLRVRSWWIMAALFALSMLVHPRLSVVFFAFTSFLALKEYFSLIPTRRADRRVLFWAYLAIPVQYLWVAREWYGMFIIFIPVYMFLLLPIRMVTIGQAEGFLRAAGTLHWGLMTAVFSLSHAAFLLVLPAAGNPGAGSAGLLLFLVLLTEGNDVLQFVWGKGLGRHKVVPRVSPGKTWEGLLGGLVSTTVLAYLLAPVLTPFGGGESLFVGSALSVFGFFGDLSISSMKRDLSIKDSGDLIPGHGGVLDRVDSLTYTAPLFFHYVRYFHF